MDIETLKRLMKDKGESQVGIARLLGITPDKVSKMLAGKRELKLREANLLRSYFGLDEPESSPTMLPVVGLVAAGQWREGFENIMGYMPSPDRTLSAEAFVVIVEGDSMDKIAQPGEGIVVDPRDRNLIAGRYYVIRSAEGETTFKQYCEGPARLEPCSTNPDHRPIVLGHEEITVIGRARKRVSDI
jgi:repressor LexA